MKIIGQAVILVFYLIILLHNAMQVTSDPMVSSPSSVFEELLAANEYVDKTLLIKEIFDETEKILLTAPQGFGKSTNLEMVKRFLEINTGTGGEQINVQTTTNYKLFKNNNLKICEHKDFVEEHFGQYPVIFLDYSPLGQIDDFKDLLNSFRTIINNIYSQNRFLLQSVELFTKSELEFFNVCSDSVKSQHLTKKDIENAFSVLPEMLFRRFKKPVFVLIDEFDVFEYNLIFQNNSDTNQIISFIQNMNNILLQSNVYLGRALLMGRFTVSGIGLSECVSDIMECSFARDHNFNKYFGITDKELDVLLMKLIKDCKEREQTKNNIIDFYKGYRTLTKNINLYNTRSVIRFLHNKRDLNEYLCSTEFTLKRLLFIFSFQTMQDQIEHLLNNNTMQLEISHTFSREDIASLRTMARLQSTDNTLVQLFFYLLFELGYLSMKDGSVFKHKKVELKIPNLEIKLEFATILRNVYINKYNLLEEDVDIVNQLINKVSPETVSKKLFEELLYALNVFFGHAKYQSKNENGFQSILLASLMKVFPQAKSIIFNRKPRSIVYIILKNHKSVSFIISVKTTVSETKVYRKKIAIEAHKLIVKNDFVNSLDQNSRDKVVFLGISCSYHKNITIAYSYLFKEGDEIKKPIVLTYLHKVK